MTPDQALELLFSATTMAKLTKDDHIKCEQARATLLSALHPAVAKEAAVEPANEDQS